jgi:hypothetical protein
MPQIFKVGDEIRQGPSYKGKIIARTGDIALLFGGGGWEVVVIQRYQKDYKFPSGSVVVAGTEKLPSSEQWGAFGWTPGSEAWARAYFAALVEADNGDKSYRNTVGIVRQRLLDAVQPIKTKSVGEA